MKDVDVLLNAPNGNWCLHTIDQGVRLGFLKLVRRAGRLYIGAVK